MNHLNPEIEASLNSLAELVCESLQDKSTELVERRKGLLKTLLMSGYSWKSDDSLMKELEDRVKDQCRDKSMHRGGALSSVTAKLDKEFKSMARQQSHRPKNDSPPKPANISSATNS